MEVGEDVSRKVYSNCNYSAPCILNQLVGPL